MISIPFMVEGSRSGLRKRRARPVADSPLLSPAPVRENGWAAGRKQGAFAEEVLVSVTQLLERPLTGYQQQLKAKSCVHGRLPALSNKSGLMPVGLDRVTQNKLMRLKLSHGTTGSIHSSTQKRPFFLKKKQKKTVCGGSSNCWISNVDKGINDVCRVILFRLAPLSQQLYSHNTAVIVPDQPGGRAPYMGPDLPSHGSDLLTHSSGSSSTTAVVNAPVNRTEQKAGYVPLWCLLLVETVEWQFDFVKVLLLNAFNSISALINGRIQASAGLTDKSSCALGLGSAWPCGSSLMRCDRKKTLLHFSAAEE